jgi:hypothetical protein
MTIEELLRFVAVKVETTSRGKQAQLRHLARLFDPTASGVITPHYLAHGFQHLGLSMAPAAAGRLLDGLEASAGGGVRLEAFYERVLSGRVAHFNPCVAVRPCTPQRINAPHPPPRPAAAAPTHLSSARHTTPAPTASEAHASAPEVLERLAPPPIEAPSPVPIPPGTPSILSLTSSPSPPKKVGPRVPEIPTNLGSRLNYAERDASCDPRWSVAWPPSSRRGWTP